MILNTIDLLKKYNFSLKDLMLHYTAVGGEIPSDLIDELGITQYNKYYITRTSNFKGFFIYRKGGGLRGYQLQSKGIDYLLKTNNEYATFTTMNFGKRKITSDLFKRKRYQRRAWLYHYLDELEINYFPSQTNATNFFYCSEVIKKLFTQLGNIENIREYEIKGSRIYGTLRLNNDLYNVYVFDDSFDTLSIGIEYRANILVSEILRQEKVESIIFAHSIEEQKRILSEILNAITSNDNKYNQKQYSFFRQSQLNGLNDIHILSFDETGKKQLELMKNKKNTEKAIRKSLSKKFSCPIESSDEYELYKKDNILCDARILDQPCYFIDSLNINKIKQAYDILTSEEGLFFYFVCFECHIPVIQKLFSDINVGEYIKCIPIEVLELPIPLNTN